MTLNELQERLQSGNFNRWLDVRPVSVEPETVNLEMVVREDMLGSPITGAAHGGIAAALIDIGCAFAWLAHNRGRIVTIDLRADFHRPLMPGIISIHGALVRSGRSIVTADARLTGADGRLCASGRATMKPYLETEVEGTNALA